MSIPVDSRPVWWEEEGLVTRPLHTLTTFESFDPKPKEREGESYEKRVGRS